MFTRISLYAISTPVRRNVCLPASPFLPHPAFLPMTSRRFTQQAGNDRWQMLNVGNASIREGGDRLPPQRTVSRTPAELWAANSVQAMKHLPPPKDAYAGRSFEVRNGDVGGALALLQACLQRNKVYTELRMTTRHEQKGEKRRRLRSERWRRRFANEVRNKVQLVNAIRRRGA
ncbi:hypothetical protein BV25DRAFT_666288 [Artomyces pyxidatus]|uniref:Uncharacterized protein n=1 Tax=Artomyces pyxidatus TaxID=48021 RepID=A0ACB8T0R1_9AGAM|nr:hypothetical protein BV25DRAFT_666288 [Artomyces pyxidatus]